MHHWGLNGCIALFSRDHRTSESLLTKGLWISELNKTDRCRKSGQTRELVPTGTMCVFRNRSGWVSVLCRFWLVHLTAMYHGVVWAVFLSDKQPQSLPCLSAPNKKALPAFFRALLQQSPEQRETSDVISTADLPALLPKACLMNSQWSTEIFLSCLFFFIVLPVMHTSQSKLD